MIDSWSSQRLLLRSTTPVTVSLISGQPSYTITPKPIRVVSAYLRDVGNTDSDIDVKDIEFYNNLTDKSVSVGQPMYVAYDPGASQQTTPVGTLYVYYTPDKSYTLRLEVDSYLTEFVNLTDTVSFEPAYYEALIYGLAARLFRQYNPPNVGVPQDIVALASNGLSHLRTMNSVQVTAGMDLPGKVSSWNVYSGDYV